MYRTLSHGIKESIFILDLFDGSFLKNEYEMGDEYETKGAQGGIKNGDDFYQDH